MNEIPRDIMATARTVADSEVNFGSYEVNALAIARAILAERRRCADVAREQMLFHVGPFGSQPAYVAAHAIAAAIEAAQ